MDSPRSTLAAQKVKEPSASRRNGEVARSASHVERRQYHRALISERVRVRPIDCLDRDFEEVCSTVNASRGGLYFTTRHACYYRNMPLSVTFPFSPLELNNLALNSQVVRVDALPEGHFGVAVEYLRRKYLLGDLLQQCMEWETEG